MKLSDNIYFLLSIVIRSFVSDTNLKTYAFFF